jgi:hypothetical protein
LMLIIKGDGVWTDSSNAKKTCKIENYKAPNKKPCVMKNEIIKKGKKTKWLKSKD